ncbi:uncharacterized protein LOC103505613 isoform X2 [Diaphorina citri]|uniref:Uncharacterized protein LOC103505613 isoform X1 n=1 Tax=Diaphorina citri TaxID=121845 RepID=A0A1S3CW10_DIACI|nr:uncharacterized protein LOC103505613 isoform X1 [Diaphorina citri]XP_008468183.1 uncharacterized protein LOC103505613 isoform X2 [Diaphorina citri]
MTATFSKLCDSLKSINYFSIVLLFCQTVILLLSSCTIYKKQLHNRFAIGIGVYETKVRVHYRDLTLCATILVLHILSHLSARIRHLPSVPYSLFLGNALFRRYAPFVLQCFSILKHDSHLKNVIFFKLTTLLYVLFGCVQCFTIVTVLMEMYREWKPRPLGNEGKMVEAATLE